MTGLKRSEAGGVKKSPYDSLEIFSCFFGVWFFLIAKFLLNRNITNVCDALLLTGLLDTLLAHEWTVGGI